VEALEFAHEIAKHQGRLGSQGADAWGHIFGFQYFVIAALVAAISLKKAVP
jgi:hypothetical protein